MTVLCRVQGLYSVETALVGASSSASARLSLAQVSQVRFEGSAAVVMGDEASATLDASLKSATATHTGTMICYHK